MNKAIHYSIVPKDLAAHLFEVTVTVRESDHLGQIFVLPAWIPGSYMIREFARNIVTIEAQSGGQPVRLKKLDKHTWQAAPCDKTLTLRYDVYAWDLSVRAAHLDQTRGFFNGTSVFLRVQGAESLPHVVDIRKPADPSCRNWRVATALTELKARRYGFGTYSAENYDELVDHPVEMGDFELATFRAHGVPHDIVITGCVPNLDLERIAADLKKICEAQIAFFEPNTKRAPMKRYVFLTMAVGEGYGGLEHRASTALLCSRNDLPVKGQKDMSDAYRGFLGLCSHEYFHTWNVKRIKPAVFAPYDLGVEAYTSLLWLFEGFTSYYDDLMLVRSGVIDEAAYCKLLARQVNGVLRGSGRFKQSVAESSFDAWTKYYRQDENSPNAIVSYYAKGALVALALDLTIRTETKNRKSLDDVMRTLWQRYGRDFYSPKGGMGVTESDVEAIFDEATGLKLKRTLDRFVNGTADLPLEKLLRPFGVEMGDRRRRPRISLGAKTVRDGGDCKLSTVYENGAAHRAGLSAGDVLIALDDLRVTAANLDSVLARYRIGDTVKAHAFRRDELMEFDVKLMADDVPQMAFSLLDKPATAVRMRAAWLG
jgi:predicted metalloprotease with PDZ domain